MTEEPACLWFTGSSETSSSSRCFKQEVYLASKNETSRWSNKLWEQLQVLLRHPPNTHTYTHNSVDFVVLASYVRLGDVPVTVWQTWNSRQSWGKIRHIEKNWFCNSSQCSEMHRHPQIECVAMCVCVCVWGAGSFLNSLPVHNTNLIVKAHAIFKIFPFHSRPQCLLCVCACVCVYVQGGGVVYACVLMWKNCIWMWMSVNWAYYLGVGEKAFVQK